MKKILCLLMILVIGVACQEEEKVQNNEEPKEEVKEVKMAALNICGDTEDADILLLCADSSYILCDAENREGYSVLYMNNSINNDFENGLTVFLDEKGIPVMASSSDGQLVFRNVTGDSFDFAFIDKQNEIIFYNDIKFDFQSLQSRSMFTTRSIFDPWIDSWKSLYNDYNNGWDEYNKKAIVPFLCKMVSFLITAGMAVRGKDYIGLTNTFLNEIYKSSDYKNEWLDRVFFSTGIATVSSSTLKFENGVVDFTPNRWSLSALAALLNKYGDEELKKLGQIDERVGPHFNPDEWKITLSPNPLECYPDEDTYLVDVNSKATWEIDTSQVDNNWCKVMKLDVQVAVIVKSNESEYDRACNLVIYAKNSSEIAPVTLIIKQSGIVFELSEEKLSFTQAGGSKGIYITTNDNIDSWEVTSYPSWCKIEEPKGKYSFFVDVEKNENDDREGIITVTAKTHGGLSVDRKIIVEQKFLQCPDDNHPHAIDLGLPSGIKWACCNIGASKPEEIGNCYAWGETETKMSYNWNNYRYWTDINGNGKLEDNELTNIGDDISGTSYDAAKANWGASWRMPTHEEFWEMVQNTSARMIMNNKKQGYNFKGKNGNEIFIPCNRKNYEYWMSNISTPATRAKALGLNPDWIYDSWGARCSGLLIRPISK